MVLLRLLHGALFIVKQTREYNMKKNILASLVLSAFIAPAMAEKTEQTIKDKAAAEQNAAQNTAAYVKANAKDEAEQLNAKKEMKHKKANENKGAKADQLNQKHQQEHQAHKQQKEEKTEQANKKLDKSAKKSKKLKK